MKTIVILQPAYLPWMGYFNQVASADAFVFLDDVLYTKNDWRNRNRIKTPTGQHWLTVPVKIKNRISEALLIKDAEILNKEILKNHLKTIELNYTKAPYFNNFFPLLSSILNKEWKLLANLDMELIKLITDYLKIKNTKFFKSSEINIEFQSSTDRLIKICKKLNATHYLTGPSAKNYLDEKQFIKNNIKLEYQNYKQPIYSQLWGEFIPSLSIIDLLFNEGYNSLNFINNKI